MMSLLQSLLLRGAEYEHWTVNWLCDWSGAFDWVRSKRSRSNIEQMTTTSCVMLNVRLCWLHSRGELWSEAELGEEKFNCWIQSSVTPSNFVLILADWPGMMRVLPHVIFLSGYRLRNMHLFMSNYIYLLPSMGAKIDLLIYSFACRAFTKLDVWWMWRNMAASWTWIQLRLNTPAVTRKTGGTVSWF